MRITGFATIAFVALWASVESINLEAEPHAEKFLGLTFDMKNKMGILHNAAPAIASHEANEIDMFGVLRTRALAGPLPIGVRKAAPGSAYGRRIISAAHERKLANEDIVPDSDGDRGIVAEADEKPTLGTADHKHRGSHERHVSSADAGTMTDAEKAEAADAQEAHQHRHRRHRHTHSTSHQSGTPDRAHKHHHHHAHGEHH